MTQIGQFALVLVGVAVASMWALAKGRVKCFLVIVGAFAAWIVLPSVILQIEWGYYKEDGEEMGGPMRAAFTADSEYWAKQAAPLAAEACGDAEGFDVNDPSLQWITLPEQAVVEHFFYYSKYSNVIWLGVGWKDRFCLARYLVVDRRTGVLCPLPTQLFPYPFFPWFPDSKGVEERLIERLPSPPKAPDGVRSLYPGQCMSGDIAKGETLRFQVQMPNIGQEVRLEAHLECIFVQNHHEFIEWTKNGIPIVGWSDQGDHAGTYQVALRAPATEAKRYTLGVFWGKERSRCSLPKGWWGACDRIQDPEPSNEEPK